ncbi:hypothetical protein PAXRUDRAFT_829200 [Paxillus rubicundulus Ve08.2h10]|uniref:RING-type domain-containing protein n=1 Tax=Paxillus rubicundulus Ve08.2h10 TaxID=930991 RepID=A0A0D0E681_9AGAM|nr:hypothetical protein PAXRUDRAFT_829200 [Paxillus rubicundulus Ve08.2h10]
MQIIDIPSSPELSHPIARRTRSASRQPGPSKKRPRPTARKQAPMNTKVIIELTDSEDDKVHRKRVSTRKNRSQREHEPHVAPSMIQNGASSSGKLGILSDAGPASTAVVASGSSLPRRGGRYDPLFLPGSDDERALVEVLPVALPPDAAPPEPPTPKAPLVVPPPVVDPVGEYVVRVIEVVPDAQPAHILGLVEQFMNTQPRNVVEFVLHALFEDPSYPKVDKKGKRNRDEPEGDENTRAVPKPRIDYANKEREYSGGPHYFEISLEQLMMDFPRIPKPHIRTRLLDNHFYAPTYFLLSEELKRDCLPFKLKSTNSVVSGKGKSRQDLEFNKEREWVLLKAQELATGNHVVSADELHEEEYEDNGEGIECGCCFSSYPFDKMIQCPEAHLFCKSCMTSYASNQLGEHNPNILCMDQSGCKLPFPESELQRFLSPKLLELYHRVKQRKEIEAAGLENLEECPFCEYKCVIENTMEKLFRCENGDCGAVTCRECKKPDHLPKTCKEMEDDKHLDAQHVIEEAMTRALMRNCPKCQKSFIKEMGCNKMTCPNCHTMSCYICRSIIIGYDHFVDRGAHAGARANRSTSTKCHLWDPVEQRHAEEVSEAAKRAIDELKKARPDVDAQNIKVDLPITLPAPPPAGPPPAIYGPYGMVMGHHPLRPHPHPHPQIQPQIQPPIRAQPQPQPYPQPPPQVRLYQQPQPQLHQQHQHQYLHAGAQAHALHELQRQRVADRMGAQVGLGVRAGGHAGMGLRVRAGAAPAPVLMPMDWELPIAQRRERRQRAIPVAQAVVADGPGDRRRRGR